MTTDSPVTRPLRDAWNALAQIAHTPALAAPHCRWTNILAHQISTLLDDVAMLEAAHAESRWLNPDMEEHP